MKNLFLSLEMHACLMCTVTDKNNLLVILLLLWGHQEAKLLVLHYSLQFIC